MTDPDLSAMSSSELIQLLEDAQQAYRVAAEREREETADAHAQLLSLAEQLGGQLRSLRDLAATPEGSMTLQDTCGAIRTLANALAQVTASQSWSEPPRPSSAPVQGAHTEDPT